MQRVILNMQSYVMGDAVKMVLQNSGDFIVTVVSKVEELVSKCFTLAATAVIMEVTSYTPWKLEARLKIRDKIKKKCPDCKVVLLVDENAEAAVAQQVKQAKLDGLIDLFLYSSTSASFLSALIETL